MPLDPSRGQARRCGPFRRCWFMCGWVHGTGQDFVACCTQELQSTADRTTSTNLVHWMFKRVQKHPLLRSVRNMHVTATKEIQNVGRDAHSSAVRFSTRCTCKSDSWESSTPAGDPVSKHCAAVVFGNAMTSRIEPDLVISIANLSSPSASPP